MLPYATCQVITQPYVTVIPATPAIIVTINTLSKYDGIQNLKLTNLHRHLLFDSMDPALLAGVDDNDDDDTSLAGVQGDDTSLAGVQGDDTSLAGVPIPVVTTNDNDDSDGNHPISTTATYGSEFVAAKTVTEQIMDIRQTLRYLGAPIGQKSFLFGDNRSVVTSATLLHSTLTKCHNSLAFHRVREAIAAKLMAFYWIQSAYNLSDMLSKHWDHPTVYPMILKLPNTQRSNTRKRKENLKMQPEKVKKKEKEE